MTSSYQDKVHVVTSTETRRRWSPAEKKAIVQESAEPGQSISAVARKHGIAPSQLFYWRRIMENGALTAVGANEDVVPASEVKALRAQIRQLERILGQKTVQLEILKEAVTLAREKKTNLARTLVGRGRFPVKTIADTLEVARSNLCKSKTAKKLAYPKENDPELIERIKTLIDKKASYGYRRVTALLCIAFEKEGKNRVNHKRIYRLMKQARLLLQRHTGRAIQTHEGKIITLKSNLRWCSDSFELRCWSGEKIQVAFSLDCCDREAMRYVATTGGINGEKIRDQWPKAWSSALVSVLLECPIPCSGSLTTARLIRLTKHANLAGLSH